MWFLFIIFGFLSQPWTELRGYKQVQYIDISGLSPSYNYIRGWLISKTNPSEPLTDILSWYPTRTISFSP